MSSTTLYAVDKLIHKFNNELNDESNDEKSMEINIINDAKDDITIGSIKSMIKEFVNERDWNQYHTPRNILLALVGEVGELSEIFQWKSDQECKPGLSKWTQSDKIHLGEEMADILIYLSRLADICGINMKHAVLDKMAKNAKKYPSDKCKGSSKKYTEYQ